MICPMCHAGDDAEMQPLEDNVYVFCCDTCSAAVVRAFAAHSPAPRS